MALGKRLKKIAKQWSTYRGLVVLAGTSLGITQAQAAYEGVTMLLTGLTALVGVYDTVRDEENA